VKGKPVIYQLFVRLFGNIQVPVVQNGTIEENGCGKFLDINDAALSSLKAMGITHIWLTGVLEHATMSDFTSFGIQPDDWRLVKGRAGSPYAIKDYFDVSPELAVNVSNRMNEFGELIKRIHNHQMKVLIDFIPNHVARSYHSDNEEGKRNFFGAYDDTSKTFDPQNNFYYLPEEKFIPPQDYQPLGIPYPSDDKSYVEIPARVTGNNVLSATPSLNDWFETVKLNFGIDIFNNHQQHFHPVPRTWLFLKEVILFWSAKGVDGFRCDMAEMVPVEFWQWLIPQAQEAKSILFIAEIYERHLYDKYIYDAGFDYIYDKAVLYDQLVNVIKKETPAYSIGDDMNFDMTERLLNFMENHDEVRLASPFLSKSAWTAMPAVVVSACLDKGAFMIYNGQETGDTAMDRAGYGGGNGRTTIYDYWHMPEFQKWVNNHQYDGAQQNSSQKHLRKAYITLLNLVSTNEAFSKGDLYILRDQVKGDDNDFAKDVFSFVRYYHDEIFLITVNFNQEKYIPVTINFDTDICLRLGIDSCKKYQALEHFSGKIVNLENDPVSVNLHFTIVLPLSGTMIYKLGAI